MNENKQYFIVYFPYLKMRSVAEVDFGFLKLWNFNLLKDKYIPDEKLRKKVEKMLSVYQEHFIGTVKGIGVISIGDTDFRVFNKEEHELIRLVRLILFLSFLSKSNTIFFNGNTGHQMASSENFTPVYQSFLLDQDYITERDGYILPSFYGGLELDKVKYVKPSNVPSPSKFDIDGTLLDALLQLRSKKPKVFKKIINATEVFFESYYNSFMVSQNARVLLQMSAFEILLDLPETNQRKVFKEKIEKETALPEDKIYLHYYERAGKNKGKENLTLKGIWADSFYSLRNHIIHGLTPKEDEYYFKKKQRHTDIAFLFFILLVRRQINKSLQRDIFEEEILWKKWHDDNFNQNREEFVYEKSFRKLWEKMVKSKKSF